MPVEAKYRALFVGHQVLAKRILTSAKIMPALTDNKNLHNLAVNVNAVWDTGAMFTCITPSVQDRLKLSPSGKATINGVTGKALVDIVRVAIRLPNDIDIEFCDVLVADFRVRDVDMLIGMDIISLGDFVVCNMDGQTSFSFAVPPFPDRINLAEKAETVNRQNVK
ncbi:hypothetical protein FACS189450_05690 [Spirochaetia bacterium]|nr:hypothetical protein FACS189450_05690 [Spirochaetia bacterium]